MPELLAALNAVLQEHRRCGELDGGGDDRHVWMVCNCLMTLLESRGLGLLTQYAAPGPGPTGGGFSPRKARQGLLAGRRQAVIWQSGWQPCLERGTSLF